MKYFQEQQSNFQHNKKAATKKTIIKNKQKERFSKLLFLLSRKKNAKLKLKIRNEKRRSRTMNFNYQAKTKLIKPKHNQTKPK